ncbi:kinetochore protein NDC80 homolog [Culicoides brevitarsis]|uniref:kinetochore protein NDC80 homolog n=1 Tax=Culicoides brevitarsis TaxID=469753 RepID=UPI00307BC794
MYNPRRTTELMGSSHRPTERKSRLAVPTSRRTTQNAVPSSLHKRPQSVDRHSQRQHSLLPQPSTVKKGRSSSQTPRSTFQTPTTPGNRTPLSHEYLQSADKRGMVEDKLFILQEAARITNFAICQNVPGFGKDTKLRNVSFKQFTGLVELMLEKLVGNRFPLQGIDNIVKALHALDYPFTINKSWLKTPTAGHAFNHVVIMLGWLLNLVDPPLMPEGETELDDFECISNLVHNPEFPTVMYQKIFMEKAKDGFKMWNLQQDDDFEQLNEELANEVVSQSTSGVIKTIKKLDDDVIALEKEQKVLATKAKPSTDQQKYLEIEKEVKDLRRVLEGKQEIANQLTQSIAAERKMYEDEQKILKQREKQIDSLRKQISTQIMSKSEIKQLIEEIYLLRHTLEAEQNSYKRLLQEHDKEPVEVSQLIRQKVQKINQLNEAMYALAKNFEKSLPDFQPSDHELNANSPEILQQLAELKPSILTLKKWMSDMSDVFTKDQIERKARIEQVSVDFAENQRKLKEAVEKIATEMQNLNQLFASLDKKYTEIDEKYAKEKQEQEILKKELAQLKADIETERLAREKVAEETQIIMKRFVEEQNAMLEDLREKLKVAKEKVSHYKKIRDESTQKVSQKEKELLEKIEKFGFSE